MRIDQNVVFRYSKKNNIINGTKNYTFPRKILVKKLVALYSLDFTTVNNTYELNKIIITI